MKARLIKNHLSDEVKEYWNSKYDGWVVNTNDCIEITYDGGKIVTKPIFTGKPPLIEMVCDCVSHYEYADYYHVYLIDKETLEISYKKIG